MWRRSEFEDISLLESKRHRLRPACLLTTEVQGGAGSWEYFLLVLTQFAKSTLFPFSRACQSSSAALEGCQKHGPPPQRREMPSAPPAAGVFQQPLAAHAACSSYCLPGLEFLTSWLSFLWEIPSSCKIPKPQPH